ncbi:hypothetical protein THMIRHAS_11880 [Thiosulfatimonas sediminis]|uniref:Uncharacterized protein n=1 Tax=Thiosulfatimonas sediminis TaxID=2675054 RepID=A0A6F8PUL6_9GAMM|nr:hypothetical protein [Thiosulfatimonas sediminis]BBP45815.1 hypothetical protein THMIRHAS_11880 [Thiosulfatimonas sediminis]
MSHTGDSLQVSLPYELLRKLFLEGALKPKDVHCLNEASKQAVRELCLQTCQSQNCQTCRLQAYCGAALYRGQTQQIALRDLVYKNH